jgi:hypothetical protein
MGISPAATQPGATSFLASLPISPTTTGELLLLDGNGGVTILKPSLPQVTALREQWNGKSRQGLRAGGEELYVVGRCLLSS